jgi:hypothetical protein
MKYTLLAIPLILVLLVVGYLDKPPTEKEQVYSACNRARQEINMFTENYCGALQDDYKLKFVCESRDSKPNTKCRVEEL